MTMPPVELPYPDCKVAKEGIFIYCRNARNSGFCIHGSFEAPTRCRHRLSHRFPRVAEKALDTEAPPRSR